MTEPVEKQICRRLADVFQDLLPDVSVGGNWLPEKSGILKTAHAKPDSSARLDANVQPRSYPTPSSAVHEIRVDLDGTFAAAFDPDLERSAAAYGGLAAKLEEWHRSIAALKRDLTLDGWEPCGMRLSGGEWTIDRDGGDRLYSQSMILTGRLTTNDS